MAWLSNNLVFSWAWGFTLNRVSLFALIFSIGILVDDAIVITEGNHNGGSDGPVNWKGYREVAPDLIGLFPASYVEPQPAG